MLHIVYCTHIIQCFIDTVKMINFYFPTEDFFQGLPRLLLLFHKRKGLSRGAVLFLVPFDNAKIKCRSLRVPTLHVTPELS